MAATSVPISAAKMAGVYFRHCCPYIGLWTAAAKGDREADQAFGREISTYAE
jgi:hypothetical protein